MKFIVMVREVHIQMVEVDGATSETDAIKRVSQGEGSAIDNTLEFSHRLNAETWTAEKQDD